MINIIMINTENASTCTECFMVTVETQVIYISVPCCRIKLYDKKKLILLIFNTVCLDFLWGDILAKPSKEQKFSFHFGTKGKCLHPLYGII